MNAPESESLPGYVCPFCGTDCSPISLIGQCAHFFIVDGENGWRFTDWSRKLFSAAEEKDPIVFRDLLYHDPVCRVYLRLRRANYDDSLEMYVYSSEPEKTTTAFTEAIASVVR